MSSCHLELQIESYFNSARLGEPGRSRVILLKRVDPFVGVCCCCTGQIRGEPCATGVIIDSELILNVKHIEDTSEQNKAEERLKRTLEDMERFNQLMRGRERRTLELKDEINDLLLELGRDRKYRTTSKDVS